VREAALCFDNMKNMNNEPMKLLKPGAETEAVAAGQRWVGKRAHPGKGGKAVGKRTGFSHLFPDYSTQVVDFPHLSSVRAFLKDKKKRNQDRGMIARGIGPRRNMKMILTANHANHAKPENEHRTDADFGQNGQDGRNACPTPRVRVLVAITGPNRAAKFT